MVFSKRTAPYKIASTPVLPVRDHRAIGVTQGRPVFIDPDGVRDCFGPAAFAVKVDKSADTAILQETVSGHIVHGRIQAHVFNRKGRHMFFHFVESSKETDGVMSFCTGKTEQERYIRVEGTVTAGELEQCITKIVLVKAGVPSPAGIRVRIVARCGGEFLRRKRRELLFRMFSAGVCVSMYGSAIPRDSKGLGRNESAVDRRKDSNVIKKCLEPGFKIKKDILMI